MTGIVTKGKILRPDLNLWDGKLPLAATRKDSTAGVIQGPRLGNSVDVLTVYGDGDSYTRKSLADAVKAVGANVVALELAPGTWDIDDNITIPVGVTLIMPPGAELNISSGKVVTFTGNVQAGFYQIFSGAGTVTLSRGDALLQWWGAKLDGTTDDAAALELADTAAGGNVTLVGTGGNLLIGSQVTLVSEFIDFSSIEVKLAASFSDDPAIVYSPAGDPQTYVYARINIDGNKANVAANPVAFQIDGINSPHTEIHFHGHNCGGTACKLVNSLEKAELHVSGFGCGIVLEDVVTNAASPDENLIFLAGNQCDQWYVRSGDSPSSHVIFHTENQNASTGLYPVVITGGKTLTLSGLMRGNKNGSVSVNMDDTSDSHITFANLMIIQCTVATSVLITRARSISGQIHQSVCGGAGVDTDGVDLKEVTAGGMLDITNTGMLGTGAGLKLGDTSGGTSCSAMIIRQSLTQPSATNTALDIQSITGACHLTYQGTARPIALGATGARDLFLHLPIAYIQNDVAITNADTEQPSIVFYGITSKATLQAYATPFRGMSTTGSSDLSLPTYYTGRGSTDGWQQSDVYDLGQGNSNGGISSQNGTGAQTAFTIAHGLSASPAEVAITPGHADADADHYISAVDATNITVTYAAAPGSGTNNVVLYWRART